MLRGRSFTLCSEYKQLLVIRSAKSHLCSHRKLFTAIGNSNNWMRFYYGAAMHGFGYVNALFRLVKRTVNDQSDKDLATSSAEVDSEVKQFFIDHFDTWQQSSA